MQKGLKKNIIVTVEVGPRETIPNTFLCAKLAKNGFRVFLTTNRAAKLLENKIENCIFLHKSTNEKYALRFQKTMGAIVCFLDWEMGIPIPDGLLEQVCHDRFIEVNSEKYDTVFAVGEKYKKVMEAMPEFKGVNVVASGWPRFDVLLHKNGSFFEKDAELIRQKYGKFILLVSSFGYVTPKEFEVSVELDKQLFGKDFDNPAWYYFDDFVSMAKELSSSYDGKVVLRPHPCESIRSWEKLLAGYENIYIDRSGDINNYFLACDSLVQFRSSSTLEANLLGVENLSLKIDSEKFDTDGPLYRLRKEFNSASELINHVRGQTASRGSVRENAIKEVEGYIANLDGTASNVIVEELAKKKLSFLPSPKVGYLENTLHKIKMRIFDLVEKMFFSTLLSPPNWVNLVSYKEKLEQPIDSESVRACIARFQDSNSFDVKDISRDLVQIDFNENLS